MVVLSGRYGRSVMSPDVQIEAAPGHDFEQLSRPGHKATSAQLFAASHAVMARDGVPCLPRYDGVASTTSRPAVLEALYSAIVCSLGG
jgi:hypothetical protein